ncbi:MAG: enolase C-terminal domain-like protein [Pseudolabrys sp.]
MSSAPRVPQLTVRAVCAVPVEVPLNFVLGTSQQVMRQVPLVLIDVETEEGVTGRSYLFGYLPAVAHAIVELVREVEAQTRGQRASPAVFWQRLMQRFTLVGVQGVVRMAIAGFDVAMWDAAAQAAKQPLCRLLGAAPRPVRAYNSCGLGLKSDKGVLAAEAEKLLERGFGAVKLRLGYATLAEDIDAVRAVKKRIGANILLMVDYNQMLPLDDALERGRALDGEGGIYWLEEPIRHDDYAGAGRLTRALTVPIQTGENFNGPHGMSAAIEARATDYVMPDLERIGGVTGWMRAAELAAQHTLKMSSHLFPEVSAHLLTATPTCHFLEYVDWADVLLEQPLAIKDGHAIVPDRPGNGMVWNKSEVDRHRIR